MVLARRKILLPLKREQRQFYFFLKYSYLDMLGNTKVTLGSYLKYEDLVEEFGDLRRKD